MRLLGKRESWKGHVLYFLCAVNSPEITKTLIARTEKPDGSIEKIFKVIDVPEGTVVTTNDPTSILEKKPVCID